MTSVFVVLDNDNNIVAWARDRVGAIGNKEYKEREGHKGLRIVRVWHDDEQYSEVMKKIFKKN